MYIHWRQKLFLNAVKCNLTELTTRSTSLTSAVSGWYICVCATGFLVLLRQSIVAFRWRFSHRFSSIRVSPECEDSLEAVSPPLPLLFSFHCFIRVTGACFFSFHVGRLMAGLPGFASHGRGLHLGAGCQYWKLLDISGTQPQLCEAAVN